MTGHNRLLTERPLDPEGRGRDRPQPRNGRPARSVTVNITESPLGWLFARGHLSSVSSMRANACGSIMSVRNYRSE